MDDNKETPKEHQKKPISRVYGVKDGKSFTTENQPSPEAKKAGWQELRKRKLLTQEIIKKLLGKDGNNLSGLEDYMDSLVKNAKLGNPKAIETINKAIEEEVIKISVTTVPLINIDPLNDTLIEPISGEEDEL